MRLLFLCALLLAACNTPSPGFRGIAPTRITVDGSTFDVRVNGLRAEAIRINAQYAPRFGPIRDRARRAMARISGCEVASIGGDQALAFGTLDCGNGPPPPLHRSHVDIACFEVDSWGASAGSETLYYECEPI